MNLIPISKPYVGKLEKKYSIEAIKSTWISSTGNYIEKFEKSFCKFNNSKYSFICADIYAICSSAFAIALA